VTPDGRRRAIIAQRTPPPDPQRDPSLWVAADPVVELAEPIPQPSPAPRSGHRVPATADFDELMSRGGLSPVFLAEHVAYRKDRRRA
jgi:hypothetical protein